MIMKNKRATQKNLNRLKMRGWFYHFRKIELNMIVF